MGTQLLEPAVLEQVQEYILDQLPRVLEQDPRFVTFIEGIVAEKFPRRDELARMLGEIREQRSETKLQLEQVDHRIDGLDQRLAQFQTEVNQRFGQVDQRFEQMDQHLGEIDQRLDSMETRMEDGFHEVQVSIDRLGARWGIRNESIFRQTMQELLEHSFGVKVEERHIGGEQFDCVIYDGQHILVEIAASVRKNVQERLERKRQLYIDQTGVVPARFIFAVGSIHSRRAEALRAAGFEVIEPEE